MHAQSLELEGEDKGFLKYVQQKKMKKCPSCKMWVEKADGCNAMLCRCEAGPPNHRDDKVDSDQ